VARGAPAGRTGGKAAKPAGSRARRQTRRKPAPPATADTAQPVTQETAAPAAERVSLDQEVEAFSPPDPIALGDLEIRKNFANRVMVLFAIANVGALIGLAIVFWQDCVQLAAGLTKPADRIIDGKVIMALLGASTVQLGTVIYTITRAIFPSPDADK
jgi:hypothetical protein